MESVETTEAKATMMEEITNVEKELSEAETWAAKVEGEFQEQKKCLDDLSKNIIHLAMKLREVNASLASMHQRMIDACQGEA